MLHFSNIFKLLFIVFLTPIQSSYADHKKIGVIVPLEHGAIAQIISGITESLDDIDLETVVQNAHGDSNIMLALVNQMKSQNLDIIMPIGTASCQMTIAHIKNKPIICVAAKNPGSTNILVTGVNDEVPTSATLSKLPKLKHITVIYSASEKIAPEIDELKKYAMQKGVSLHLAMVQALVDLPLAVKSSPKNTEAFLILKDNLIASGINILTKEAKIRSIPLIASDEGSVSKGACMAISIKEKSIGVESAHIARAILNGAKPSDISYKSIDSLVVFVNEKSMLDQKTLTKDDISGLKMPIIYFGKE
jgi:putative ABC transport system substrate-binding protein